MYLVNFIVHIAHNDIPLIEAVDNPLVIVTLESILGTSAKLDIVQIGTGRAIGTGYGSTD